MTSIGRSPNSFRIATWNLERPRASSVQTRVPHQLAKMHDIDADVWILTETSDVVDLSETHPHRVLAEPTPGRTSPAVERWVAIWSRYRTQSVETQCGCVTAAARVATPGGDTVVYGTVLPYCGDPGPSGTSRNWTEHLRALGEQGADWKRLRDAHPGLRLCVAGDFNQSRDGRKWGDDVNGYREWSTSRQVRERLTGELKAAGLRCATENDFYATGELTSRSSLVHIAVDADIQGTTAGAWEAGRGDGVRLSDHNGVWVDVPIAPSARLDA